MARARFGALAGRGLELAGLSALALAQPLLDVLGREPAFFVAHGAGAAEVVAFALAVLVGPPLALLALEALAGLAGEAAARWTHLALVALLVALLALYALGRVAGGAALPLAFALGALAAFAAARAAPVRSLLRLLGGAPLVVLAAFLLRPSMAALLRQHAGRVAEVEVGKPAPVVFVLFDELSGLSLMDQNLELDAARYPGFARLARDAYWFRNATTVHFRTETAVPAMLSGRYPDRKRLPVLADHPDNLFTLLGGTYAVTAFETLTRLCPPDVCRRTSDDAGGGLRALVADAVVVAGHVLLPPALAGRLPAIDDRWAGFGDGGEERPRRRPPRRAAAVEDPGAAPHVQEVLRLDRTELFSLFLDSLRDGDGEAPGMWFLHILLPHTPWTYLPSGRVYSGRTTMDGVHQGQFVDDPWRATQGVQRYLLQVGYVDRLVGRLVERLEAVGLYDRALVVVTADHGVASIPGEPRRSLGERGAPELLSVPLFVKLPGQTVGVVSDRNVEIIDVLPTVAHALGVRVPWATDGRSALDDSAPERPQKRFARTLGGNAEWRTFDAALPEKRGNVERLVEIFGTGASRPNGLWAFGPHRDLAGQPTPAGAPRDPDLSLSFDASAYDSVRLDSSVPARLAGTIAGAGKEDVDLAIGVNGVIAALTRTRVAGRRQTFTAMLPESALRDGDNRIEVFAIREREGEIELTRVPRAGE